MGEYLDCTCCGKSLLNNAVENVAYGEVPYPYDTGYGLCVECGGDKTNTGTDEASIRKRLGWAGEVFYDSRIEMLTKTLNAENSKKFQAMSYGKKIVMVARFIEKGIII